MRRWRWIIVSAGVLLFSACTHSVHNVYFSDYSDYAEIKKGRLVEAHSDRFIVMGFTFDTRYVERAYTQLMMSCKNGEIKGITTEYATSHGFFSWHDKIYMKGICYR